MKKLKLIFALILFLLFSGNAISAPLGLAANENDPKKEKILMDPDESKKKAVVVDPADSVPSDVLEESANEQDSSIHSVNKFNYIFYFIYKLKYDENGAPEEYLEYLF